MTGWLILLSAIHAADVGREATALRVDASHVLHKVSPLLHGACTEDVNHEIYGGIYSQTIFGESFKEPPRARSLKSFTGHGGRWLLCGEELDAAAGEGPKPVMNGLALEAGEVEVEVYFPSEQAGNAGLIVNVNHPGRGADRFSGPISTFGPLISSASSDRMSRATACPDIPIMRVNIRTPSGLT